MLKLFILLLGINIVYADNYLPLEIGNKWYFDAFDIDSAETTKIGTLLYSIEDTIRDNNDSLQYVMYIRYPSNAYPNELKDHPLFLTVSGDYIYVSSPDSYKVISKEPFQFLRWNINSDTAFYGYEPLEQYWTTIDYFDSYSTNGFDFDDVYSFHCSNCNYPISKTYLAPEIGFVETWCEVDWCNLLIKYELNSTGIIQRPDVKQDEIKITVKQFGNIVKINYTLTRNSRVGIQFQDIKGKVIGKYTPSLQKTGSHYCQYDLNTIDKHYSGIKILNVTIDEVDNLYLLYNVE